MTLRIGQQVIDRRDGLRGTITLIRDGKYHVNFGNGYFRWLEPSRVKVVAAKPRKNHWQPRVELPPVGPERDRLTKLATSNGLTIEQAAEAIRGR